MATNTKKTVLSGFNPFNKEDEKYKYVIKIDDAGKDKDKVIKTIVEICSCTLKQAKNFVNELDDLLSDDEVCSVESKATADKIKKKLKDAGANTRIRVIGNYDVSLYSAGNNKLSVIKAIKEIMGLGLKEAKSFVDSANDLLASPTIKVVDTIEDALTIKNTIESIGGKVKIYPSYEDDYNVDDEELEDETLSFDIDLVFGGPQYYCVLNGKSFGPVTVRQFANMARFGIVNGNTLVWKNGMSNWAIASTVTDLLSVV